jgi:hypothetical protein
MAMGVVRLAVSMFVIPLVVVRLTVSMFVIPLVVVSVMGAVTLLMGMFNIVVMMFVPPFMAVMVVMVVVPMVVVVLAPFRRDFTFGKRGLPTRLEPRK